MARNPYVVFHRPQNHLWAGIQRLCRGGSGYFGDSLSNESDSRHHVLFFAIFCGTAPIDDSRVVSQPRQEQENLLQFSGVLVADVSGKNRPCFDEAPYGGSPAPAA